MRILELRRGDGPASTIELHPNLTLVQGLDPDGRHQLAEVINAMARGEARVAGLVEAHGVIFDLTSESLRLLGLNADLDLVVRPDDLPGHDQEAEAAARDLARAQADRESRLTRLERAKGVLESVTQARASLVAAIEEARLENAARARDVVMATTALTNARQERHRARSIREMVERELADARDAHQALVDSRLSTSEALERARARHQAATEACEAAAARVREAHSEVASHDAGVEDARAEVDRAETRDAAEPAQETAPRHHKARLFRSRRHEGQGGVVVTTRRAQNEQGARAVSPSPGAEDGDTERLHALEASRGDAAQHLEDLGAPAPTQEISAARDRLVELGPGPADPQTEPVGDPSGAPENAGGDRSETVSPSLAVEDRLFQSDAPNEVPVEPLAVASARLKLAKARKNREQAVANVDASTIGPEEIRRLEDAHNAVLDAQERTEARFGGARALRRLAEARGEEREILDQLGFSTYADYMMSASSRFQNGPDLAVLDTAERSLITARQAFVKAWRDEYGEEPPSVPCPPRTEPPTTNDISPVEPDGATADPVPAPEPEPAAKPGPTTDTAGEELARLLAEQGNTLGGEAVGRRTLIEYADKWLEEQQVVAWRRAELEAELDQIDRDVARLNETIAARREQLEAAALDEAQDRPDAAQSQAVPADLRRAEEELEGSGERARLLDELASRQTELEARTAEEREAAEALASAGAPEAGGDDELAAAAERLAEAERAQENALADEQAASAAVSEIEQRVADGVDPAAHDLAEREVRLEAVDQDRRRAEEEIVVAESEVELADHTIQAMVDAESTRRQETARSQLDEGSLLEDIDWYLLSRLAAQRAVSLAGSLPLVVDDAFAELPATEANWLLGRLERMTAAVQIIVLSDRRESAQWVSELGPERAAVVHA